MAGLNNFQCKPTGRRQWALRGDIGHNTLFGLRSQLAEDGCSVSQVVMAKKLLDGNCDSTADQEENSRQGVYWLIKASEQGNEEATHILQQCLEMGKGITELNFLDVKACLSMSQEEKLARQAARKMFSRLSAGEDFITSEQLLREIRRVRQALDQLEGHYRLSFTRMTVGNLSSSGLSDHFWRKSRKGEKYDDLKQNGSDGVEDDLLEHQSDDEQSDHQNEDWSSRTDPPGEKLSEEHLISAAVMYAQGELPLVQRMLDLQHITASASILSCNPLNIIARAYTAVVDILGRQNTLFIVPPLSTVIQIILAIVLYLLFESIDWLAVVPIAVFHGSFMAMVIFTFQMLHHRREFQQFRVWSGLFLRYSGGSLNPEEAEYQFCRNNLKPYAHFFVSLIINLMMYPLLASHWTPHSELTVLSLSLTFLSLYSFLNSVPRPLEVRPASNFTLPRKQLDILVLFSFAVNVLAKYPYDLDSVVAQGWRFLDVRIPTFASYVVGHGIEFCLNFRAVFYLLMPAVFLKLAARDRWRGTYRVLIPHCVTLAWWQIAVLTARGSTWYGLIRAALALVGLVLFLPLAGLATILLPLAAAARFLASGPPREALQAAATSLLAATPLLTFFWFTGRRSPAGSRRARIAKMAAYSQIIAALGSGILLLAPVILRFESDSEAMHRHPMSVSVSDSNMASQVIVERADTFLSWDQYHSMCHQPAWEQSSAAHVQRLCLQLDGVPVKWDGYVMGVRIVRIRNPWMEIVRRLPEPLGYLTACAIAYRSDDRREEDHCSAAFYPSTVDQQRCRLIRQQSSRSGRCLLTNWDSYDFEVEVKFKSGIWGTSSNKVFLQAEDHFRNLTFALRPGDHVWFSGTLANFASPAGEFILGGSHPVISLREAGCIDCKLGPASVRGYQNFVLPYSLFRFSSTVLRHMCPPTIAADGAASSGGITTRCLWISEICTPGEVSAILTGFYHMAQSIWIFLLCKVAFTLYLTFQIMIYCATRWLRQEVMN